MAITTTSILGGAGKHVIPKFYADFMRDRLWSSLYFRQLGTEVTVPRGYETVKIPRWKPPYMVTDDSRYNPTETASNLSPVTTIAEDGSLTPGVVSAQSISGDVAIFAGAIAYTEKTVLVSHASITDGATENLIRDLTWKLDTYTRKQISSTAANFERGSNPDSATGGVTSGDVITGKTLARLGPIMDSLNVPRWSDETFVCVCHPLALYDVMTDTEQTGFLETAKYNDAEKVYRGEVGRMYGIRFIQTNTIPILRLAAAGTANGLLTPTTNNGVTGCHAYVVAPDAYYVIHQEGGGVSVIHHPPGSAGTEDPANLKGTLAVKVYYGVLPAPAEDHRLMWFSHALSIH